MSDVISGHAKDRRKVMPDAKMQRDLRIGLPSRGGAPGMSVGRGEGTRLGDRTAEQQKGTSR